MRQIQAIRLGVVIRPLGVHYGGGFDEGIAQASRHDDGGGGTGDDLKAEGI
jgi:hypothetical protein